jgi:hypothetical protein
VRLAERSGFSVRELVACLALGNYHADYTKITEEHVAPVRTEIEDWLTGVTALREDLRRARLALTELEREPTPLEIEVREIYAKAKKAGEHFASTAAHSFHVGATVTGEQQLCKQKAYAWMVQELDAAFSVAAAVTARCEKKTEHQEK